MNASRPPSTWQRAALILSMLVLLPGLLGAGVRPAGLGDITDIRLFSHDTHTRVVIELSRGATYSVGQLRGPERLYVDIDGIWAEPPAREARTGKAGAPLRLVRAGQNTLHKARVVLELGDDYGSYRVFRLSGPDRIVLDLYPGHPGPLGPLGKREAVPFPEAFDERPVRRIMIDPGHGGKDPGASAKTGVREKDVVLRIAKALRDRLKREGFEVLMTRDRDRYLTLEQRTAKANAAKADLFVSIHANASRNRKTSGVETYLLDTRYDRQTARVAARENGVTVGELNELQKILASLKLGYNERFAAPLAQQAHQSLLKALRGSYRDTKDLGVKRGPFLVLFMADMPAILVEVGFLSNRTEAKRLQSKTFVKSASNGLARGIVRYREEQARRLVAGR